MRSSWMLFGVVAFLAVAAGCETTQPLQLSEQHFEFRVEGLGASTTSQYVWNMYEDLNDNGVQDPEEVTYYYCQRLGSEALPPTSVPFEYTIQVTLLRAGTTEWEPVTSGDALSFSANLSLYDGNSSSSNAPFKNPITIGEGEDARTFRFGTDFEERRVLSGANRDIVSATTNPLHDIDPVTYPLGDGLCSSYDPGFARVDNQPLPLNLTLLKGDSLKVELRRGFAPPEGMEYSIEPQLRMLLLLDGRSVTVQGDDITGKEPGAGASFTYTFR